MESLRGRLGAGLGAALCSQQLVERKKCGCQRRASTLVGAKEDSAHFPRVLGAARFAVHVGMWCSAGNGRSSQILCGREKDATGVY